MTTTQFTGSTIDEVLRQIRAELGEDALIVQTRRVVKGGIGGFFGREMIEVTAASGVAGTDDEAAAGESETPARGQLAAGNRGAAASVLDVVDEEPVNPFSRHLAGRLDAAVAAEDDPAMGAPPASPASAYARAGAAASAAAPRPFAPGGQDRTSAIIEAARQAMRAAEEARAPRAAAAEPQPAATLMPPAEFIPARRAEAPRTVSAPRWERVETPTGPEAAVPEDDQTAAPVAPEPAVPAPAPVPRAVAAQTPEDPAPTSAPTAHPFRDDAPAPAPAPTQEETAATLAPPAPAPSVVAPPVTDAQHVAVAAPEPAAEPLPEPAGADMRAVRAELMAAGVDARYLDPFLDGITRNILPFADAEDDLRDVVRQEIAARIPVTREWKGRPRAHALAFVGQSGVGKSSVVRKLAWRLHAAGLTVAIISAGVDHDPAVEALATRMGIAYTRAADADALTAARTAAEADVVLVDTPGRSHTNLTEIEELGRLFSGARLEEVHLVLPVAVPLADLGDIARRFRIAGVNRLTLTKLDETRMLGNLVNIPLRMAKPLAFLADGTATASGLAPADPVRVAGLLLP